MGSIVNFTGVEKETGGVIMLHGFSFSLPFSFFFGGCSDMESLEVACKSRGRVENFAVAE